MSNEARSAVIRPAEQQAADRGGGNRTIPLLTRARGARQMMNGITGIPWVARSPSISTIARRALSCCRAAAWR
jgi:hypothetical protein